MIENDAASKHTSKADPSSSAITPDGTHIGNGRISGDSGTVSSTNSDNKGDRDPVAFKLPSPDLEGLSLAHLESAQAFRYDRTLVIHVTGFTYGFGGQLIVEERPEKILPPLFHVHARPGNGGINPEAAPHEMLTVAANFFEHTVVGESILVEGADGRQEIKVIEVKPGVSLSSKDD